MKELFKKFTSILMVIVTLLDMFLGPICVLASEVDAKSGDLRLGNEYKSEIGESVSATEGSFKSEGDVEIRKTVTKLDNNGKYEVKFEARGKDTSETTYNEAPIYTVIVFDRSNSMTNKKGKWDNAKNAARAFVEGLVEKYAKANIAVVTFGTTANTTQTFVNSNLRNVTDYTLFGYEPTNPWDENGATNLHAGLEKAKALLSSDKIEKNAKKYVIVISDGAPTKYEINGNGGSGSATSYDCIDKPVNTAKNLKDNGVEIFTVGYDLSDEIIYKGRILSKDHPYKNSTAASILKLIATDASHYVSSDKDNIVDKLKDIVSSATVYSPAAKNLVITDNIGSAFTSESDTDKDGKITLNLDKTTSEWQEIGKFEIQIDKNSTTGWHNTNDNFTYTWEGLGETKESTKNPQVYWIQPEYAYTIKHVEKYNESNVLDVVNGKANYGSTIEVKEKSFKGYTYDSKDKDNIVIDEENNVAIVYYIRNSYNYTIKHVEKNNESNVLGTDTGSAKYQDKIDVNAKEFKGYTYDSKDKTSIIIDEENNTATVYYVRNNYNYIIKHVEKGNESNVLGTDTGSANYQDKIDVKEKTFKGFTYDSKDKETIVIDEKNNTAIVYYTRNSYNYTIKHVEKGNESNVLSTETGSANYQDKINVNEKSFAGYTYDSKDKDAIIIDEENNIAIVYYTRNNYNYIIKHVEKNNENNVLETVTGNANYQDKINVETKSFKGFTYDSKDKETIIIDTENNTAIVYYVRNNYDYTIKHVEKGNENNILEEETKSANYEDVIKVTEKSFKGFTYDSKDKETIVIDTENNIATVYYVRNNYNYTIKHVEKGNENNVLEEENGSANYEDVIKVTEKEFKGFTYDSKDKETIVIDTENNTATVYYTRNNYNYTIKHVEKGNENNVLEEETASANYEDVIKVTEKEFKGFTYDSKDKETIVIDEENNIATVYYVRNSYNYIIKHVEKGNESNVLETVTGKAKYEDVIKVTEKSFKGFTYDSKDKETIIIDEENNTATVYYTRNKYSYKVEHYLETKDGKFELKDTDEIKDVLYESKITYNVRNYENYNYDASKTINPEYVLEGNEVVKLYYLLGENEVIVHYVVKVDDNYIPFTKAAYDANGKLVSNFEGVTLTDAKFVGKIGSTFTTELRYVYEYAFLGIYEGNILVDTNIPKLEGDTITSTIDFETKEYTYVYESPKGGDVPVPPDTGVNNFSYANYLLLLVIAYLLKKYTTTEN